jgi:hypothetical protein
MPKQLPNSPFSDDAHINFMPKGSGTMFPTVIEPYDAKCSNCGRLERQTTAEFSKCCDEILVDVRSYDIAEIQ